MRERIRAALGVWAPMLLGVALIGVAVNFLLTAQAPTVDPNFRIDPLAAGVCGSTVIALGGLLILSTYGRWRKVRATRKGSGPDSGDGTHHIGAERSRAMVEYKVEALTPTGFTSVPALGRQVQERSTRM